MPCLGDGEAALAPRRGSDKGSERALQFLSRERKKRFFSQRGSGIGLVLSLMVLLFIKMERLPGIAVGSLSGQGSVREECCARASLGADPICVLPREVFVACCQNPCVEGWILAAESSLPVETLLGCFYTNNIQAPPVAGGRSLGRNLNRTQQKRLCSEREPF